MIFLSHDFQVYIMNISLYWYAHMVVSKSGLTFESHLYFKHIINFLVKLEPETCFGGKIANKARHSSTII